MPVRALGDGMNRLLGISLCLTEAKGSCLLIDEVENGIHWSVQPKLWKLIMATAERLNVQVFATTHSSDCVTGFAKAAVENEDVEGLLIRLEATEDGGHRAVIVDEDDLEVAARNDIELR